MTRPMVLKVRKGRDIHVYANTSWEQEELYKVIRYVNDGAYMFDGECRLMDKTTAIDVRYLPGITTDGWMRISFSFNKIERDGKKVCMVSLDTAFTNEHGIKDVTSVVWEFNRATVENLDGNHSNVRITLYNGDDKILTVDSTRRLERRYDYRHRCGEFVFDGSNIKEKKQKSTELAVIGGCLMCDHSVYEKEDGVIYLKCTKYDGRVKESEYTGEAYPNYCKRRK